MLPKKIREIHNHHFDSTIWNDFGFRDDDIIIASYPKAGTTWVQQIISQLLFHGQENINVSKISPWLDLRIGSKTAKLASVDSQTHRRFLKTHLPTNALVFSNTAKYIYIGRDGREIAWSLFHHHSSANEVWYKAVNDTPGRVGPAIGTPPGSVKQYYKEWLEKNGFPFWPFWENVAGWWAIRKLPNVYFIHYSNLKRDLSGEIRHLAHYLDIPINEDCFERIVEHCTFSYMKANARNSAPMRGLLWRGGAETFFNKGENDQWRNTLTEKESEHYDQLAIKFLGLECANWLNSGL